MKEGLIKICKNFVDGMVNILIGGKEIDDELFEEVEEQFLVVDIGVDVMKIIIINLIECIVCGDLIYLYLFYKVF